jgi:hypothetical protein
VSALQPTETEEFGNVIGMNWMNWKRERWRQNELHGHSG